MFLMHYHFNMTFLTNIIFLKCWKKNLSWSSDENVHAYFILYETFLVYCMMRCQMSASPLTYILLFISCLSTVVCHFYCCCSYLGKTGRGPIKRNSLSNYGNTFFPSFQSQSRFQAAFYSWQSSPSKTIILSGMNIEGTFCTEYKKYVWRRRVRVEVNGHIKMKFSYKCTD